MSIVHNLGSSFRILPEGRKGMVSPTKSLKNLSGSFWGICAFHNINDPVALKNYKRFRENSKRQGLKLIAVELAYNNNKFQLEKSDAEIIIQLRSSDLIWQKERLINIGIKNLPEDCDKFVWIDPDVVFLNDNWINETCKLLEEYKIVQPFNVSITLKDNKVMNPSKIQFNSGYTTKEGKIYGFAYRVSQLGYQTINRNYTIPWQTGIAWAARKEIFYKEGLFDKCVFPFSSIFISHLIYNSRGNYEFNSSLNHLLEGSLLRWHSKTTQLIDGSVYFTDGAVLQLAGKYPKNLIYNKFKKAIKDYNFNPEKDIVIGKNGCWKWNSKNRGIQYAAKSCLYSDEETLSRDKIYEIDRKIGIIGKNIHATFPVAYTLLCNSGLLRLWKKYSGISI